MPKIGLGTKPPPSKFLKYFLPIANAFIPYVSVFTNIAHVKNSEKVLIKEINNFNLEVQALAQRQILLEDYIQNSMCQQAFRDNQAQQEIIAASEIRNYVQLLENEVIFLRLGEIPKTSEFIKVIEKLCTHISTNSARRLSRRLQGA